MNDIKASDNRHEHARACGVLGRFDEAIALYDEILASDPANERLRIEKASLYRDRGHLHRYLQEIDEILVLNPKSSIGLREKYVAQATGRRPRAAAETLFRALESYPKADDLRILLVSVATELNWLDFAKREADKIPHREGTWWPGAQRKARERYEQRRAQTSKLLSNRKQVTPEREKAFAFELGLHLAEIGRLRISAKIFKQLMRDNPTSYPSFARYTFVLERRKGIDAVASFLENLGWLFEGNPGYDIARIKVGYDKERFADLSSDAMVNSFPIGDEPTSYYCGYALAAQGDYEKLNAYSKRWLTAKPKATSAGSYLIGSLKALEQIRFADISNRSETSDFEDISIVQFWDKKDPPHDVIELMSSWQTHNPMLSYRRFSEASASDFILLNFGEKAAKAFELCHHAAMKSDYFRLSYLYKNGGVYVDADDRCLKPIDPIIANLATTNLIASVTDDFPGYVHNWFLAANPGSQVLGMALAQATNDIIDSEGRTPRPDIWQTTGPGLITRCIAAVCARSGINVDKEVRLMTLAQYRNFVQEQLSLSYKNSVEGNWRNA